MAGEKGGERNGEPPPFELVRRSAKIGGIGSSADEMRLKPSKRSERGDGDCVRAIGSGCDKDTGVGRAIICSSSFSASSATSFEKRKILPALSRLLPIARA